MQHAWLLQQDQVAMLLCCAVLEAPCMFNTSCADLELPFDQLLKKEEAGMGGVDTLKASALFLIGFQTLNRKNAKTAKTLTLTTYQTTLTKLRD